MRVLIKDRLIVTCLAALALLALAARPSYAEDKRVTFNFIDVDLPTVAKFISDATGKNFIFDDSFKGKITIIAPSKLRLDEAFNLFTSMLKLKGYTAVPSGVEAYKIIPAIEARQNGIEVSTEAYPVNETYIVRIITLRHISSEDAIRFLQPVVSKDGHISSFGPGNLLLVVDSGLNMEKIIEIVGAIDQPPLGEEPELVMLEHASANDLAKLLNEGMKKAAVQAGREQAKAVADERLNAVVLFGDKSARESMKRLVTVLDVPTAKGTINVYFLENADAEELAKVIEDVLRVGPKPPTPGAPNPFQAASGIMITPHKATNSLVIVASPADYASIVEIIKKLDRKRKQVYVEAMIVEASIDRLRDLGTRWRLMGTKDGEPVVIGGVGSIDQTSVQSIIGGLAGLTIGGMGNYLTIPVTGSDGTESNLSVPGFAALFSLNEFRDAVNVLSTPQILTSDNNEAEIVVGENVPFITKREADPTRTASVFSSIERKDVGITLRITPLITEGDHVKLDIYQEISSVKEPAAAIAEAILTSVGPTTTKRSTKTTVVVKDDQTVVIGGLMQEKNEQVTNKVPLLGDLPILGWLFKQKSVSKRKTNLLVFLTPHIVRDPADLAGFTEEKRREFAKSENQFEEGELLVKFKDGVSGEEALEIIGRMSATVIKDFHEGLYLLKLKKGQDVEDSVKKFDLPEVEYAEPNFRMKAR